MKIECVEIRTVLPESLFSFHFGIHPLCLAAAPSNWKEVKSVTGFNLTDPVPAVSYFLLHYTLLPVIQSGVCVCVCVCAHYEAVLTPVYDSIKYMF